ncbi:hypothetical protein OAA74_02690 [Flavobacteriaceae bacterium]|nr:hypothetical protein [Flavobacteriaceae bacterium]
MNQKTITNQILEQKNFTLNSTLNYLFNISNMKKLFSYLLISSMVVLSSCTNYDDQFDDLNSQITSLKSQIEGFSSLSSGLTALQGTVASLQSAVAQIPTTTTDVSGLEASVAALQASLASASTSAEVSAISTELAAAQTALADAIAANGTAADTNATDIAALQTSLEAVSATLAELKTALAGASTTAEVAALTTSLAAVQSDLTDLLNQNNIYSTAVEITDDATLDFADALGNKLNIVNAKVEITQTKEMDAVQLQTVMNRIKTVTGLVTFNSVLDAATVPTFDNLTSVSGIFTINQKADVSLPKLKTASTLTITDYTKVTSVSAPMLETYSTLTTDTHAKVTNYSMPMLKRFSESDNATGAFTLTVDGGTVDFSSVTTISTDATPIERADAITINGATIVKAPKIVSGTLTMNSVTEPNFPVWEGTSGSVFAKAKKVVLPSIKGGVSVNLNNFAPKATYFHMIGAEYNDATSANDASLYPTFTTTGNTTIETLILDGSIKTVTVSGATDLTSYTHTGKSHDVDFIGNTSMTSVTFGHTTTLNTGLKGVAITYGTLDVTGNTELTSVSAPELDDISVLNIHTNAELTTLSFPKLNSLGKASDGTTLVAGEANVNIYGNALSASNIQLPSLVGELPVVKGKITSTSGINALSTYIAAAVALKGTSATSKVTIDKVNSVTDKDGDDVAANSTIAAPGTDAGSYSTTNTQTWLGEDKPVNIVNLDAGDAGAPKVNAAKQVSSYGMAVESSFGATDDFIVIEPNDTELAKVTFDAAFKTKYGLTNTFVAGTISTWAASAESELNAQLDAGSYAFDVAIANDFGKTKSYLITNTWDSAISGAAGRTGGNFGSITFTYGGKTMTQTVSEDSNEGLHEAIVRAMNLSSNTLTPSYLAATVSGGVKVTPRSEGLVDYSANPTFGTGGFNFAKAAYSNAVSLTSYLGISGSINTTSIQDNSGWRLTVTNESYDVKADLLDLASSASHTTASPSITFTELVDGTSISGTNNALQRDWQYATKGSAAGANTNVLSVNIVSWL